MSKDNHCSPAEIASKECLAEVFTSIDANKNFLVEAGAGAGKTYTLIKALKHQINKKSDAYLRANKQIACITYTNVAKNEIKSRTDNHPVIFSDTIHAFAWALIKDFQKDIRRQVPELSEKWKLRVEEAGGLSNQAIVYSFGYPKVNDKQISLHHDDVIKLLTFFLQGEKFRKILTNRFPVIFIDEYQDTDKALVDAIIRNFIETETGPLVGFFGDHWQKIYGTNSCGLITAIEGKLKVIGKQANFRSDKLIVDALNKMRPELAQHEYDSASSGEITIFHSNEWQGQRRSDGHWKDDLPKETAHDYLSKTLVQLTDMGWLIKPETTKILMLTNNLLSNEQGYQKIFEAFNDTDDFLKKKNDYISFLTDIVEPGAEAFQLGKYGEMLNAFNLNAPKVRKHSDKEVWYSDMGKLNALRQQGTIGDIINLLKDIKKPKLSRRVEEKEHEYHRLKDTEKRNDAEEQIINKIETIRAIPYSELTSLLKYIDDKTLFSTKHGVKGAEFENVLVVFGRGWNHYNWNQMLEWSQNDIPQGKEATFERNRNLFYVACSRPKKRLALLFTQKLSNVALARLNGWFGSNIIAVH